MKIVLSCTNYGQSWRGRSAVRPAGALPGLNPETASRSGFTLVESVIAALIVAFVFAGIIQAYLLSGRRLQWTQAVGPRLGPGTAPCDQYIVERCAGLCGVAVEAGGKIIPAFERGGTRIYHSCQYINPVLVGFVDFAAASKL